MKKAVQKKKLDTPTEPQPAIPTTDETLRFNRANVCVGDFVALRMAKYDDEIPQIARVTAVQDLDITVEWWIGRYHDTWREWKANGATVSESLPLNAVIKRGFQLTKTMRLPSYIITELKALYDSIELI